MFGGLIFPVQGPKAEEPNVGLGSLLLGENLCGYDITIHEFLAQGCGPWLYLFFVSPTCFIIAPSI